LERGLKPLPNGCLGIIIKINLTTNYQLLLNCNKVHRAGCGRWTYITYAGENGKRTTVISAYLVLNQHQQGVLAASQHQYQIQYQDESLRPYILNPHRQTMVGLKYFSKPLRAK
jgi:ABC-type uncharacterized transport system YnjBCD ATPase subunit